MRVVLDTNVLVSAFVFPGGPPEAVYRRVPPASCRSSSHGRCSRVLVDRFAWDRAYAEEVVAQLVHVGGLINPPEAVDEIYDDPDDNRVLEAAAEGDADLIVSGDRHLLGLASWREIIRKRTGFGPRRPTDSSRPRTDLGAEDRRPA